jgi:hypothetical protein
LDTGADVSSAWTYHVIAYMHVPLTFVRTIRPLALAVLPGVLIVAVTPWPTYPFTFSELSLLWYVVPLAYTVAAIFVMPVFALWPASRRPSPFVAALWGGAVSCIAMMLLGAAGAGLLRHDLPFLASAAAPGAGSGMAYAWLVRREARL